MHFIAEYIAENITQMQTIYKVTKHTSRYYSKAIHQAPEPRAVHTIRQGESPEKPIDI